MYNIDLGHILASNPDLDHHDYANYCCQRAQVSREVLESDCIRAFLDAVGAEWYSDLCKDIAFAVQR